MLASKVFIEIDTGRKLVSNREPCDQNELTRRTLLSAAALGVGSLTLSPYAQSIERVDTNDAVSDPLPPFVHRDPSLTTSLVETSSTLGVLSRHKAAFPAVNVKDVLPLNGLAISEVPWLAVSIVGTVNQLQIVDPFLNVPVHVINVPNSHVGGIGSLAWDAANKILYLTTLNALLRWNPASPKRVETIGNVPRATSLYDLQLDSSHKLWGGTYPNGAAFSYDPSERRIRVHDRLSSDTDYVRRLAIGDNDKIFVGTGSLNPRLYSFSSSNPDDIQQIALPNPIKSGFISSIDVLGNRLVVSASSTVPQLLLEPNTDTWVGTLERVWSARKSSTGASQTGKFYTITKDILYATDPETWKDTALGKVDVKIPLAIISTISGVSIVSQDATGLNLKHFDLGTAAIASQRSIRLEPSAFTIQSLMCHSDGNIYMGGYMGAGIAAIAEDSAVRWHSPHHQNIVNQIEGMIEFSDTRTYIGSYGSADIISMDSLSKDLPSGYRLVERLSRKYNQSRPFGWAANSQNVFFGTVPNYGHTGGVLGMIDPASNKISWVLDGNGKGFVKAQSIVGLVADENYVYGTSSVRNGYGLPDTKGPAQVFKLRISTQDIVWQTAPVPTAGALYSPMLVAGWLVLADIEGIHVIDPETGERTARHLLSSIQNANQRPGWASADLVLAGDGSKMVHAAGGRATIVDFRTGTLARIGGADSKIRFGSRLSSSNSGRVFGTANKSELVELDLNPVL